MLQNSRDVACGKKQPDKPHLSHSSKYGVGYKTYNPSSPHPPHLLLFRQAAVNVCP